MITVIVGPKGSGKTTVALSLMNTLHGLRTEDIILFDDYSEGYAYIARDWSDLVKALKLPKKYVHWKELNSYVYITTEEITKELFDIATYIIETCRLK